MKRPIGARAVRWLALTVIAAALSPAAHAQVSKTVEIALGGEAGGTYAKASPALPFDERFLMEGSVPKTTQAVLIAWHARGHDEGFQCLLTKGSSTSTSSWSWEDCGWALWERTSLNPDGTKFSVEVGPLKPGSVLSSRVYALRVCVFGGKDSPGGHAWNCAFSRSAPPATDTISFTVTRGTTSAIPATRSFQTASEGEATIDRPDGGCAWLRTGQGPVGEKTSITANTSFSIDGCVKDLRAGSYRTSLYYAENNRLFSALLRVRERPKAPSRRQLTFSAWHEGSTPAAQQASGHDWGACKRTGDPTLALGDGTWFEVEFSDGKVEVTPKAPTTEGAHATVLTVTSTFATDCEPHLPSPLAPACTKAGNTIECKETFELQYLVRSLDQCCSTEGSTSTGDAGGSNAIAYEMEGVVGPTVASMVGGDLGLGFAPGATGGDPYFYAAVQIFVLGAINRNTELGKYNQGYKWFNPLIRPRFSLFVGATLADGAGDEEFRGLNDLFSPVFGLSWRLFRLQRLNVGAIWYKRPTPNAVSGTDKEIDLFFSFSTDITALDFIGGIIKAIFGVS